MIKYTSKVEWLVWLPLVGVLALIYIGFNPSPSKYWPGILWPIYQGGLLIIGLTFLAYQNVVL